MSAMIPRLLFCLSLMYALIMGGALYVHIFRSDDQTSNRDRILKFAVCQDCLILLSIVKMFVLERCSVRGVARRLRDAGALTHLYLATVASLHGALLAPPAPPAALLALPAPHALPQYQLDLLL